MDICTENISYLMIGCMFIVKDMFKNNIPSKTVLISTLLSLISSLSTISEMIYRKCDKSYKYKEVSFTDYFNFPTEL